MSIKMLQRIPSLIFLFKRKILSRLISSKNYLLTDLFQLLKRLDFNPRHIVDIGANKGLWTRMCLRFFPDAKYTLIEPQSWLKKSFEDLLVNKAQFAYHAVGVGGSNQTMKFTIHERDDSCNFITNEKVAVEKGYRQLDMPVLTLDEILKNSSFPEPDIIKIDAEGLDLDILKGASLYIGRTEVILIEAGVGSNFIPNDIVKVLNFMDSMGYRLFDITDLNRPFDLKILWLVELVFIKRGGVLESKINIF